MNQVGRTPDQAPKPLLTHHVPPMEAMPSRWLVFLWTHINEPRQRLTKPNATFPVCDRPLASDTVLGIQ